MNKAYDALYRGHCLYILVKYGLGPSAIHLLQRYRDCLTMYLRAGGYFGYHFEGQHGMTQGDPLSPKIFNMVVNTVLQNLITVELFQPQMGRFT